jgi:hypothetical protein
LVETDGLFPQFHTFQFYRFPRQKLGITRQFRQTRQGGLYHDLFLKNKKKFYCTP